MTFSFKNPACSNHQQGLKGFYGTFDSIVWLRDGIEGLQDEPGARVLNHELVHYFQNYYTATGVSYFAIILVMYRCLQDMLRDCPSVIDVPLLEWLPHSGHLNADGHSMKAFDRAIRLQAQIRTSCVSSDVLKRIDTDVPSCELARSIALGRFSLNIDDVHFSIGEDFRLPIDYQAICESMALAQELFFAAAMHVRGKTGLLLRRPLSPNEAAEMPNLVNSYLTQDILLNPKNLQYTFPFLYLLRSGYNGWESAFMVAIISFVALSATYILPGVPEFGVEGITKFGGVTARKYVKLLQAAFDDKFLDILNDPGDPDQKLSSYLDRYTDAVELPKASDSLDQFSRMGSAVKGSDGVADWLSRHMERTFVNAASFAEWTQSVRMQEGLSQILNTPEYLREQGAYPAAFGRRSFINLGETPQEEFDDMVLISLGMNALKCALLGTDDLFPQFQTLEHHRSVLTTLFKESFGVSVKGWQMSEPPTNE